jgi:hypothetical protein
MKTIMKKFVTEIPLLAFILAACVTQPEMPMPSYPERASPPVLTSFPSPQALPVATHLLPTSTPFISPTPRPTEPTVPGTPSLEKVIPQVVKVCPEQQEVPITELGLDPRFRLLISAVQNKGGTEAVDNLSKSEALMISGSDPTPQVIPIVNQKDGWKLSGYRTSPSGKWLILYYMDDKETQESIWLSSFDSRRQLKVATIEIGKQDQWISDEEMIITGVPNEERYAGKGITWDADIPLADINPFTGETRELAAIPDQAIFDFYFTQASHSYAIYHTTASYGFEYFLFNYEDNTSTRVFQWLSRIEGWHYLNPGVYRRNNGLFLTILNSSYGFDLAIDLDMNEIRQDKTHNEVMKAIILPGGDDESLISMTYPDLTTGAFPVSRISTGVIKPVPFYVFDFQKGLLKDYCLELNFSGIMSISPNDRFVALNLYTVSGDKINHVDTGLIVLDMETGHFARIDAFESDGWGIVEENSP